MLLLVQLVALLWWCDHLAARFALTRDAGTVGQFAYLVAHGHLNPYVTSIGYDFWRDHAAFTLWPLGFFQLLWPHPVTVMWVQAATAVGSEMVALGWMCDIAARAAARDRTRAYPAALVLTGALLLATNPWVVWACSFDVHIEAFAVFFLLLAARDLFRGRRMVWLWVALSLATGDVSATYLAGLGFTAIITGRRFLRPGVVMVGLGLVYFAVAGLIHATQGTLTGQYDAILGNSGTAGSGSALTLCLALLRHPFRALRALWTNHTNLWANISPTGIIGWVWLPVLGPAAVVLLESGLTDFGGNFALPGSQNLPLVPLSAVGMVGLFAHSARSGRARSLVRWGLLGIVGVNAVVWAAVFLPGVSRTWLRVAPATAAVLSQTRDEIPQGAEVVISQGEAGGFADRPFFYPILGAELNVPVHTPSVWFVITPTQGIETAPADAQFADIEQLSVMPTVRLMRHAAGVWVFKWTPPRKVRAMDLGASSRLLPAWALAGPSAIPVLTGPQRDWYAAGNGQPGYVVNHDYWREPPGTYRTSVSLATSANATVEVWDNTTGTLMSRTIVPPTNGRTTVSTSVTLTHNTPEREADGWGIWRMALPPPIGDQLEIRVYSPGGSDNVSVYSVGLVKLKR